MEREVVTLTKTSFAELVPENLQDAAREELRYLRALGSSNDLLLATANLGGYEAVLQLIASEASGVPVHELVASIQTKYATTAGVLARLRAMRDRGILESAPGRKKSQVCLVPSQGLLGQLGPILVDRHGL